MLEQQRKPLARPKVAMDVTLHRLGEHPRGRGRSAELSMQRADVTAPANRRRGSQQRAQQIIAKGLLGFRRRRARLPSRGSWLRLVAAVGAGGLTLRRLDDSLSVTEALHRTPRKRASLRLPMQMGSASVRGRHRARGKTLVFNQAAFRRRARAGPGRRSSVSLRRRG